MSDGTEVTSVGYLKTTGKPTMYAIVCENGSRYKLSESTGSGPGTSLSLAEGTSLEQMIHTLEPYCKQLF